MNNQTLTNSTLCNFVVAIPEADIPLDEPIRASSRDYGFDFDEEELGKDLLAPLPANLTRAQNPDEFEKVFELFIA